jgi:hypothetical protein
MEDQRQNQTVMQSNCTSDQNQTVIQSNCNSDQNQGVIQSNCTSDQNQGVILVTLSFRCFAIWVLALPLLFLFVTHSRTALALHVVRPMMMFDDHRQTGRPRWRPRWSMGGQKSSTGTSWVSHTYNRKFCLVDVHCCYHRLSIRARKDFPDRAAVQWNVFRGVLESVSSIVVFWLWRGEKTQKGNNRQSHT